MKLAKRIAGFFYYLYYKILGNNIYKENLGKWFYDNGEETLLVDHVLNQDSIVFDVGGYIGVFSDRILKKYSPNIYIFEPVDTFYKTLVSKYNNSPNVHIFNYGLSGTNGEMFISVLGEKSSVYSEGQDKQKIALRDVSEIVKELNLSKDIDLISINIEGGEYSLLDRIIESGFISHIKELQVQFHTTVPNAAKERKRIVEKLLQTHNSSYSYPFVWEGFVRKS
ncbi:MAG: Methyltransferase, FkbM family protein [candidate division WWE3 bacterium GW2011_GWC1_41_7]|uniref:Methyltransferase, FkbM family protein n=3 Tax=Katanobacteria TaxID=422282 RepID=A0A0G0ZGH0_UNCKA|nr:MAG: Methyltransferase, FkbM family protein [candidate division WWE3 bacterium GW2011_GWB1_41_6]KKS21116.1 MAG: Methyltransferase, FkbM family protein [candidate division WWE3 bacterium GW2011_GWC1_41_7]KKS21576.1 MAG: Methyltransferase, FkbM family protein [candidate division WWE3 bacterium GW2011_GWA1_41_8]